MCGIFAYLNYNVARERRYIVEVLFNGLRRLEYRGYDSSGIAIDSDCRTCSLKIHESDCNAVSDVGVGIERDGNLDLPYDFPPPLVFRQEGKIESLVGKFYSVADELELNLEESFSVHAGIAHTRWATHGMPAPRNNHPQSSGAADEFLVVHNGIITNYEVINPSVFRSLDG